MSRSSVLLVAGGALLVLYLGAVFGLPEPPEVDATGEAIAAYFADNADAVQRSMLLLVWAGVPFLVVLAIVRGVLPEPHRDVFFGAGIVVLVMTGASQWFVGSLSFDPGSLEPASATRLYSAYEFYGPVLTGAVAALAAPVALAALREGALPRWLGWLSLVLAVEQLAETATVFGDSGFAAPGGEWNLLLGAGLFVVWLVAVVVTTAASLRRASG